jgi:hypothetical protein
LYCDWQASALLDRRHDQPKAIHFFEWIDETDDKGERTEPRTARNPQSTRFNTDMRGILAQKEGAGATRLPFVLAERAASEG